jgi:hypothetical protein
MKDFGHQGDEDSQDNRNKREDLRLTQSNDDFKSIMAEPSGRRFMWELLGICCVFRASFTGNSETFFREGMRNVGLTLLNRINDICPEHYVTMLLEQRKAKNDSQ